MTTTFNEREQAFERKFVLDEEQLFRAHARRDHYLGIWAAEKMGKSAGDAESYGREVVRADLEEAGEEDVFRKVRRDLDAAGCTVDDAEIRRIMIKLLDRAKAEIKAE